MQRTLERKKSLAVNKSPGPLSIITGSLIISPQPEGKQIKHERDREIIYRRRLRP